MITVIGGVNGAGKSSIVGSAIRDKGGNYFNPDEYACELCLQDPQITSLKANSDSWHQGKTLLEKAIKEDVNFTFESTLGGNSITASLVRALTTGRKVRVYYVGLNSPELHIARVAARVSRGGHDIPEAKIRERWVRSINNVCALVQYGADVVVWDNSTSLSADGSASPRLQIKLLAGEVVALGSEIEEWAKPIIHEVAKKYDSTAKISTKSS